MTTDNPIIDFEIDGDCGLLAVVDSSSYPTFVSDDWTYEMLADHFIAQTATRRILVWDCGDGGDLYRIRAVSGFTETTGFREATGTIVPSDGYLNLVSYTALTMAAQFEDETLPAADEAHLKLSVPSAPMRLRVIQLYDPDTVDYENFTGPHFQIEYQPGEGGDWSGIAWERPSLRNPAFEDQPAPSMGILDKIRQLFRGRSKH